MSHKKNQEKIENESNPFKNDMILEGSNEENNETLETENSETPEMENSENSEISALQEKYNNLNNQYVRLAADFDNYRKRQEQERENLLKYGAENTLKKLIEVLDNFDRGQKAVENIDDCQQVKDSFNLVLSQMKDVLSKLGLEVIETEGQEFNPNFHEAVMRTPTGEYPENTIINELQKGYKIGEKVLRAALVNVATAE